MAPLFKSLVTELATAFNEDGSIDHEATAKQVEYQLEAGVEGFFAAGLAGESHEMNLEERRDLVRTIKEASGDQAKVMACVFVASVREGKHLIDLYSELGVDALCYTTPPFFVYNDDALDEFQSELFEYSDIPSYVYNCREMARLYSPELIEKWAKKYAHFTGLKDASRDLILATQYMMRVPANEFDYLGGCDATIAQYIQIGALGTVSFMGVPFPRLTKKVCDLALTGHIEEAMVAQFQLLRLRNLLKQTPFNAGWIYAQEVLGAPVAHPRRMPPSMRKVEPEIARQIELAIDEIGAK